MMTYRDQLEARARACCPPELWYELLNTIDETPDEDLQKLIDEHENRDDNGELSQLKPSGRMTSIII